MRAATNVSSALVVGVMLACASGAAEARIQCDGSYQIQRSGEAISTPYCREQMLARVARSYGMRFSDDAVRHNESVKAQVCRFVGTDLRVREICQPYQPESGQRWPR
jgi:hypothetical protein